MTLEKGTLLEGRYRINEILGQGGMGFVYHALDESLGVEVAVKENLFTTDEYARQFRMEAVILAGIRHPNLPRVTDHFVIDNLGQYLVMDYVEGNDLRQYLEKFGLLTETEAIRIGAAACDALTYLHTRKPPILHRDIKLGNIKITSEGQVFLVDFGLAKMGWAHEETMAGARAMTPGYSPPEQYGAGRTDARSDIYSLSATLYAALTGNIPEDSLLRSVDGVKLTPLLKHRPDISPRLAAVIEKALETGPSNRYQTAEEFKDALLGNPPPAVPPSAGSNQISEPAEGADNSAATPTPLPAPKRLPGWLLASLLIVLLVGLAGIGWFKREGLAAIFLPAPTSTSSMTPSPTLTATFTNPPPTATASPTSTASQTPSPVATQTNTPTQAATETPSPSVAQTKTASPQASETQTSAVPAQTPQGGGQGQVGFAAIVNNVAQIMLINSDQSSLHPLTNVPLGACDFGWSPDGRQIAFVSPCIKPALNYPNSTLYLMDVETGKVSQLPFKPGGDFDPAWSPDGKKIAFTSLRDGTMQIYVFNLVDSSLTRLTNVNNKTQSRYPTWSPDSSQIAYTNLYSGIMTINGMAADGKNKRQVVLSGGMYSEYAPAWSRDGTFLIFSRTNTELSAPSALVRYDFMSNESNLLPIPLPAVHVAISPDGQWLAYESHDASNIFISICQLTSSQPSHLVTALTSLFDPAWRPGN